MRFVKCKYRSRELLQKTDRGIESQKRIKELDILPYLSVGSASFMAGDNVLEVKETADNDMYQFKKTRKTQAN